MAALRWLANLPARGLDGLERRRWLQRLIAWTVGLGIAVGALGQLRDAGWSVIDDHEIAMFIGPKGYLSLRRFWLRLLETEAAHPGGYSRYRPAYYIARLTETMVWGHHPGLWFCARIFYFAVFLAAVVWVLRRFLSVVENAYLAALLATYPLWSDVFARLGPGETYCVLGAALYAIGFDRALDVRTPTRRSSELAALQLWVGGVLAIGAKENFVLLALPTIYLAWRVRRSVAQRWVLGACAALVAFAAFVGVATVVGVKLHGHVYKEDVSAASGRELAWRGLSSVWGQWRPWIAIAGVVLTAALAWLWWRGRRDDARALAWRSARCATVAVSLALVWASQMVFYSGKWPSGPWCCPRYDYPGLLVPAFAAYAGCYWLLSVLRAVGVPAAASAWLRLAVLVWAALGLPARGLPLVEAARARVATTKEFQQKIEKIRNAHREHPSWPFVMTCDDVWQYEPIVSFRRFMNMYSVRAPLFLRMNVNPEAFGAGSLERLLAETLQNTARFGTKIGDFGPLQPIGDFVGPPCYAIGSHAPAGCEHLTTF